MSQPLPEHHPILVVDDHPTNRQILQFLLAAMGLESEVAAGGKEAVVLASRHTYGAILMDIMMPYVDGYEATKLIRSQEFATGQHTPIIAVTALDLSDAREKCLASGMDDFIVKPISREVLRDRLQRWLQRPVAEILTQFKTSIDKIDSQSDPIDRERLKLLYGTDNLGDVLKVFLSTTEVLLTELKNAIRSKDRQEAARVAHELKGSAFAISASKVGFLAREVEQMARSDNWDDAQRIYAELAIAFVQVQGQLNEHV